MKFRITHDALNGHESVLDCLDAILGRVEDSVHELAIHDADKLSDSTWYISSRPERRKILEEIAASALRENRRTTGPHLRELIVSDLGSAEAARQSSHTPLSLLLENAVSDGALAEAAIRIFGNETTKRIYFGSPAKLAVPAITLESRGGHGELKKLIASKIGDCKNTNRNPRCVVVTDSDGEIPGEVKKHAQEIRKICAENGIPCPPLSKRTAENYIPDEIWDAMSEGRENSAKRPMVEAIQRLTYEQRDHLRMENGNVEPWDQTNTDVVQLFQNVSVADYQLLKNCILKGKGEGMTIHALNVYASSLNGDAMQHRDRSGDLKTLVKEIEDEL